MQGNWDPTCEPESTDSARDPGANQNCIIYKYTYVIYGVYEALYQETLGTGGSVKTKINSV